MKVDYFKLTAACLMWFATGAVTGSPDHHWLVVVAYVFAAITLTVTSVPRGAA